MCFDVYLLVVRCFWCLLVFVSVLFDCVCFFVFLCEMVVCVSVYVGVCRCFGCLVGVALWFVLLYWYLFHGLFSGELQFLLRFVIDVFVY